jgi:Raf kinase inhibitor-like YbhB/YbcL family protein
MVRATTALVALVLASPSAAMQISSTDIADGSTIGPAQIYPRCGGANISPALSWSGAPKQTDSFIVTMIDEDVKPALWSHWIVVDLPPTATGLARGAKAMPAGARQITTNFGDAAYGGPCPPRGTGLHHYRVTVWAMKESAIPVAADANAARLQSQLIKDALDSASLTGVLSR